MSTLSEKNGFFVRAYMGVSPEDLSNIDKPDALKRVVLKCGKKAYQDLKRTVPYIYPVSEQKKLEKTVWKEFCHLKKTFITDVNEVIYKGIVDENGVLSCATIEPFCIIDNICKLNVKYMRLFKEGKHITVGIAQKWVNMTLKYLWILGVYDEKYEDKLEIPIDKYILGEMRIICNLIPNVVWSEWDDIKQYKAIQEEFRKICYGEKCTRIGWENLKWIASIEQ